MTPQRWAWSGHDGVPSLAFVQETDTQARDEYQTRLGIVVAEIRKAAGITQKAAAAVLDMDESAFTRWEHGTSGMGSYELAVICRMAGPELDLRLVIDPPAARGEIRRRLKPVKQAREARNAGVEAKQPPRPTLVPTAGEEELVARLQEAAVGEARDQDPSHTPGAPRPRRGSRRPSAPAR